MLLQTVRPNIVQAIRAYRGRPDAGRGQRRPAFPLRQPVERAVQAGRAGGHRRRLPVPAALRQEPDALYDCMTDLVHKAGQQPGFVVVLEQLPDNPRFDREAREQLLTCSATPPTSGATDEYPSGVSILFSSPLPGKRVMGAGDGSPSSSNSRSAVKPAAKVPTAKNGVNPNFGMNMPMMCSAFDTAARLNAACARFPFRQPERHVLGHGTSSARRWRSKLDRRAALFHPAAQRGAAACGAARTPPPPARPAAPGRRLRRRAAAACAPPPSPPGGGSKASAARRARARSSSATAASPTGAHSRGSRPGGHALHHFFCSMKCWSTTTSAASSRWKRIGVEML